jgi:hypothetical protein
MRANVRRGARWLAGVWAVAVMLAAVVMAGPAQAASAPFTDSTVAWTGHAVVAAAVNNAGNLDYYQQDGSTTWNQEVVAKCCYNNSVPSIAQTGNTVSIAESGEGGQVDYYYEWDGICLIKSLCPPGWDKQVVATAPRGTYYGPATISWTGSTVIIAADHALAGGSGAPTVLDYWYQDAGSRPWHQQQVAGPGSVDIGGPAIAWTGSSVVLAGVTGNGSLNFWVQAAGTTPWHHEHVATLSQAGELFPPSMASAGGHVVITDSDGSISPVGGNLDYWWKRVGTTDWHQQQVAAG